MALRAYAANVGGDDSFFRICVNKYAYALDGPMTILGWRSCVDLVAMVDVDTVWALGEKVWKG